MKANLQIARLFGALRIKPPPPPPPGTMLSGDQEGEINPTADYVDEYLTDVMHCMWKYVRYCMAGSTRGQDEGNPVF